LKGFAMCRSIKQLRRPDAPASDQELNEAALQYVRKISGYRKPSRANSAAFDSAVLEIAQITRQLLESLEKPENQGSPTTG
ncbi:MAG: DUF2277 domain-containing protein, partial [Chloroflexi bacterium]|nr:DUF2277 domain-containing protein [Chloroflexota bacterium]